MFALRAACDKRDPFIGSLLLIHRVSFTHILGRFYSYIGSLYSIPTSIPEATVTFDLYSTPTSIPEATAPYPPAISLVIKKREPKTLFQRRSHIWVVVGHYKRQLPARKVAVSRAFLNLPRCVVAVPAQIAVRYASIDVATHGGYLYYTYIYIYIYIVNCVGRCRLIA